MTRSSDAIEGLVSIVIPAHNASATLARALQSIADQTYRNVETIVVDDGSVDGTSEIARQWPGLDLRVVRLEGSNGASAARNKGIGLARGEFVAFLDADDEWLPDKTAVQLAALKADPSLAYVSCEPTVISYARRELVSLHNRPERADGRDGWKTLLKMACVATPSVILRRQTLIESGGFNTQLRVAEDQDLWIRLALDGPVRHIEQELVRVYNQAGGLMDTTRGQIGSTALPMALAHLERVRDRLTKRELNEILSERYASAARDSYRHGRVGAALRYFSTAIAHGLPPAATGWYLLSTSLPATVVKRLLGLARSVPMGVMPVAPDAIQPPRIAIVLNLRSGAATELKEAVGRCRRYSVTPACLVDAKVVADDACVAVLREQARGGAIEVGVTWGEADEASSYNEAYANLSALTKAVHEKIGVRPRIAKAPWFTNSLPKLLEAHDFFVDLSVTPFTDGRACGRTDLSDFDCGPFRLGNNVQMIELPITRAFIGALGSIGPALAPLYTRETVPGRIVASILRSLALVRLETLHPATLTPRTVRYMMRTAIGRGQRLFCAEVTIGERPGANETSLERFLELTTKEHGLKGCSLLEVHRLISAMPAKFP